jgi:RNA polymerase sigma-70 factor (ECF subfamily)
MPSRSLAAGADRTTGVLTGRFTRKTSLEEPDGDDSVATAVSAAQRGEAEGVRYLYVRFADNVYGYVRSIVHDDHEAEDVTQDVFAKLMRVIGKYEDRGLPFHAWILRVARNVAVDYLRARRALPCEEIRGAETDGREVGHQRAQELESALAELPDDQREVLVLRHFVGMSPGEIAGHLDKSEGSIHGLHHRGRLTLQAALTRLEAGPSVRLRVGRTARDVGAEQLGHVEATRLAA